MQKNIIEKNTTGLFSAGDSRPEDAEAIVPADFIVQPVIFNSFHAMQGWTRR